MNCRMLVQVEVNSLRDLVGFARIVKVRIDVHSCFIHKSVVFMRIIEEVVGGMKQLLRLKGFRVKGFDLKDKGLTCSVLRVFGLKSIGSMKIGDDALSDLERDKHTSSVEIRKVMGGVDR